jgi:DNA-binding NarL/FixJ family response regulator
MMIQVAIIEDDIDYMKSLSYFINVQKDMTCVLTCLTLGDFYENLDMTNLPDVILLDQHVGTLNSVEHLDKIYKLVPNVRLIVVTGYDHPVSIRKFLTSGVSAYYSKGEEPLHLLSVVRDVMNGNSYLSPNAVNIAVEMIRQGTMDGSLTEKAPEPLAARLPWNPTAREINVIQGLLEGKSYKEIANSNYMTVDGVRYYIRTIYPKLGVTNRDQMIRKLGK